MIGSTFTKRRRGSVGILYLLGVTMVVGLVGAGILMSSEGRYARGARMRESLSLEQMAAGGVERARAELAHAADYAGAENLPLGMGQVRIRIERPSGLPAAILVTAAVPTLAQPIRTLSRRAEWPAAGPKAGQ
jgi:hypothetical protein